MPTTPRGVVAFLCLGFTLVVATGSSRADDSRSRLGAVMRAGTVVGSSGVADADYTTLGGAVAAGVGVGRIGAEVEYDYLTLQSDAPASVVLADVHRIAINGRLDAMRFRGWLGSAASMTVWAELGVGRQWTSWRSRATEPPSRLDTTAGFGWRLDHPASRVRGWPRRMGWVLGWRFAAAPGLGDAPTLALPKCSGAACRPRPSMSRPDVGLLVHSSIVATW